MNDEPGGLIFACILDGSGGGREIGWEEIGAWTPDDGFLWVHLDFQAPEAVRWIRANVAEAEVAETLLAEDTRPRCVGYEHSLLVTLRGVNLNPQSDPEDMVSVRIWIGPRRVVSTRHRRILAVNDARESLAAGAGPRGPGDFLVFIASRLVRRAGPILDQLSDMVDALEGEILEGETPDPAIKASGPELRRKLGRVRRQAIELRRYLAPQREAMTRLQVEAIDWLTPRHKVLLREVSDHITRHVEDLDALRDRGAVIQDELRNRISEDMNRTMYVLTVVASVLLPLSFVTGLLGINVEGIPGSKDAPLAFWAVVAMLGAVACVQVWLFRRLRWL